MWLAGNGAKDTQVLKFTNAGRFIFQIGKHGVHNGSNDTENFWQPTKLWEDVAANEMYVADGYGNRRVIVLDVGHRQVQAALGRLRRAAERRADAGLRSEGAAVEAVQHGALRDRVQRRLRLRVRPRQRPHPGVPQGRHVRAGSLHRHPHVPLRVGVGHDVLARSAADLHLRGQRRGREDQHPAAQLARGADVVRRRRPRARASSSASTTWRPIRRGISTRPRPTPARVSSASSTRASAR